MKTSIMMIDWHSLAEYPQIHTERYDETDLDSQYFTSDAILLLLDSGEIVPTRFCLELKDGKFVPDWGECDIETMEGGNVVGWAYTVSEGVVSMVKEKLNG